MAMTRDDIIRMAREAGIPESETEGVFIANSDDLGRLIAADQEILKQSDWYFVEIINYLWEIIDDIDTFSDMAKHDDKLFRRIVEKRQKDRWETGITSDGYTLNIPNHAPLHRELKRKFYCLTDEEHVQIAIDCGCLGIDWVFYGATVERKLREKNGL